MTKKTTALIFGALLWVAPSTPASAQGNQDICSYYGNLGAAAIDFLMPLKFNQVVDMVSGKDKALLEEMSKRVESKGSAAVKQAVERMGKGSLELMGEAAGLHGFQLVMTGQATNGQEVFGILASQCMQAGPKEIVDAQRRARALQVQQQ